MFAAVAWLALLGGAPAVAGEAPGPAVAAVDHVVEVGGLARRYRVVAPPDRSGPLPVVIALHGEGGTPESISAYTRLPEFAVDEGFLAVFPEGAGRNWDYGAAAPVVRSRGFSALWYDDEVAHPIDDVAFLRAVVDDLAGRYGADRGRVFVTGISSGALFCHRLAAEASDLVAAIAPVSGGMTPSVAEGFDPDYPVSLLAIVGDADPLLPIEGGPIAPQLPKDRGRVVPSDEVIARYLTLDGIEGEPTVEPIEDLPEEKPTSTERITYPPGPGGFRVVVYEVAGGGHNWPGREPNFPVWMVGRSSHDFDGTRAIWSFFASCPPRQGRAGTE